MTSQRKAKTLPTEKEERLRAVWDLRAHNEQFAAARAARNVADGVSYRHLQDALHRMDDAIRRADYAAFHKTDWEIHRGITELASVPKLPEVWDVIAHECEAFSVATLRECFPDLRALGEEHHILVESICSGDAGAAREAAATHLEGVWYRLAQRHGDPLTGDDPLQRATAYLAFHFHRPTKLSTIAREVAFVTPPHLSRLFRQRYDVSFKGYLQALRLDKAAELLQRTCLSVGHISRRVGYRDASRFSQHFRRRFEMSPREYRRAHLAQT